MDAKIPSMLMTMAVTALLSIGLTVAVRTAARRWRVVDRPDAVRRLHKGQMPLWGGVAVYLAMVLGLLLAVNHPRLASPALSSLAAALIPAAGLACLFGALDDLWRFASRTKLALQLLAVLPIVCAGYWIDHIVVFGYPIVLGWGGIPLTILWLLGCINALNLIDGMDGLASIVGLSAAAMMSIIAVSMGNNHVAVIAIVLAGALGGFLVYNLPPASIFLGDSGSTLIGLVLGILGIQGAMKTSATLAITGAGGDHDLADVRRGDGRGPPQTDGPELRRGRPAAHPSPPLGSRLAALAGVVHPRRRVPDHGGRRHGRHRLPQRCPGLDHGREPGGADGPPAAVRPLRVDAAERGDQPAAEGAGEPLVLAAGRPASGREPYGPGDPPGRRTSKGGLKLMPADLDLDVGVVYTHEQDLMPRLLCTAAASGDGLAMRLVLVDNASAEGVEPFRNVAARTRIVRNRVRLPYAANLNRILEVSTARYLLLLNTDMFFDPPAQCLARMVQFMDAPAGVRGVRLPALS